MPLPLSRLAALLATALTLLSPAVSQALQLGDILVADRQEGLIVVDPASGSQTYFAHVYPGFTDVVCDPMGNIYAMDTGYTIMRVNAATGAATPVSQGGYLMYTRLIDITPDGTLIVPTGPPGFGVVKVNPLTGAQTLIAPGLRVDALAVADVATAYVMTSPAGAISEWFAYRLDLTTGDTVRVSNVAFHNPSALAMESSGNFVALEYGGSIRPAVVSRVFQASGAVVPIASGAPFEYLMGVAIETNGRILVTDQQGSDPNCRRPPVTCRGVLYAVDPASGARTVVSTQGKFYELDGVDVYRGSGATPVRTSTWGRLKIRYR